MDHPAHSPSHRSSPPSLLSINPRSPTRQILPSLLDFLVSQRHKLLLHLPHLPSSPPKTPTFFVNAATPAECVTNALYSRVSRSISRSASLISPPAGIVSRTANTISTILNETPIAYDGRFFPRFSPSNSPSLPTCPSKTSHSRGEFHREFHRHVVAYSAVFSRTFWQSIVATTNSPNDNPATPAVSNIPLFQ